jgi:DNA-binding transcriptional regulator YiaG
MASTNTAEQFLKIDVLGRVRTPPNRRKELVDEFERSGISGAEFARVVGVNYQTFATWVQARRKKRGVYLIRTCVQ